MRKNKIKNRIRKIALSMLGTTILVGGLFMACRIETESMMSPTYEKVGVVMHNEYINPHKTIVTVNIEGEAYKYYADSPEKLLSEITVEMNSRGTLTKKDDELIDVLDK